MARSAVEKAAILAALARWLGALAFSTLLPALSFAAGPGTSAATFLNLGFGARPLAVGEAYVALADDAAALHYNPAGLAYGLPAFRQAGAKKYEMLLSHSMHVQDIKMTQMGFIARPYGLSVTHLGLGDIEARASETARPDNTFGANDLMIGASMGKTLGGVGFGATGKVVRQTIGQYSATAYAADLGTLYRLDSAPLSFGASVSNLGTKIRFVEKGFSLPTTLRLGATYGLSKRFPHAVSLQVDVPRDGAPALRLGMEYAGFGPFALRAGYRTYSRVQRSAALGRGLGSTAPGLAEFYGMFMGVGFRSPVGSFDYAILPVGELGNSHRFSFNLKFGGTGPKLPVVREAKPKGPNERLVERLPILKQWGPR